VHELSRGELIATGDELVTGAIADTNGAWAAARLREAGVAVERLTVVGDGVAAIEAAVREAAARAPVVVVSGGLGPTEDDRTAEAVARAAGVRLVRHARALEHVRGMFARHGVEMTPNNEKQADLPEGAEILDNPVGTAVGFAVGLGRARVYCLPGVPHEYRRMIADQVLPRLAAGGPEGAGRLATRVLRVYGYGESKLATELAGLDWPAGIELGYRAVYPEIHLRLYARSAGDRGADLDSAESRVRARLGARVFARDEETLAGALARLLVKAGLRLACAESCTGGLLSATLTSEPGASAWFERAFVTYSDRAKIELLDVAAETIARHGAVSEPTVLAMAAGARARAASDVALAVTGIAGPSGGTPEKPVGTVWIATAGPGETRSRQLCLRGDRDRIRTAAVWAAMDQTRRLLLGVPAEGP
jgi:nicotinamide-nucleotide amidase